jgi:hypothetical protein
MTRDTAERQQSRRWRRQGKIAAIAAELVKAPKATAKVIAETAGIRRSDVNRPWGPLKNPARASHGERVRGYVTLDGRLEAAATVRRALVSNYHGRNLK